MSKWSFPTFHFYPIKLAEESKRIQKKYKNADEVPESIARKKLSRLLNEIRSIENKQDVILAYSKQLKKLEINILATEYPYETEDKVLIGKISLILRERYSRLVGRRFWIHFQHRPLDEEVTRILKHAFSEEKEDYLALKATIRKKYNIIFASGKVLNQLSFEIGSVSQPLEEVFKEWKIDDNSKLAEILWLRILLIFIAKKRFIEAQGLNTIVEKIEKLPLQEYKKIVNNYLGAYEIDEFHEAIIRQLIRRLLDPRESLHRWNGISSSSIEKVKQYLYRIELYEFLDYDRFEFWKKYIQKIDNLKVIKDPPIAAMYFGDFVALEFAKTGNAAYFYETEGFTKYISPKLRSYVWESTLKDKDAHYFINKLNHAGAWHSRFDEYMTRYFLGHYWYIH